MGLGDLSTDYSFRNNSCLKPQMGICVPVGHRPGVVLGAGLRGQIIANHSSFLQLHNWLLPLCSLMPRQVLSVSTEFTRELFHCLGFLLNSAGSPSNLSREQGTAGLPLRPLKPFSPVIPWGFWYKPLTVPPPSFCKVLSRLTLRASFSARRPFNSLLSRHLNSFHFYWTYNTAMCIIVHVTS